MVQMNEELQTLKNDILNMWSMVINQINKSREIVETFDKNLAREIKANEKRIDAYELKIDMECERVLALFNPVANDLRFVMSVLKINYNLERIGDYAYKIAKSILSMDKQFSTKDLEETKLFELFNINLAMLTIALKSFDLEDNKLAIGIFKADEAIDKVNKDLENIIAKLIKDDNTNIINHLNLFSFVRKLERLGDHIKNIAEEIVFYLEAKVLRHHKKKQLLEP